VISPKTPAELLQSHSKKTSEGVHQDTSSLSNLFHPIRSSAHFPTFCPHLSIQKSPILRSLRLRSRWHQDSDANARWLAQGVGGSHLKRQRLSRASEDVGRSWWFGWGKTPGFEHTKTWESAWISHPPNHNPQKYINKLINITWFPSPLPQSPGTRTCCLVAAHQSPRWLGSWRAPRSPWVGCLLWIGNCGERLKFHVVSRFKMA
jgi:hypothetical protein